MHALVNTVEVAKQARLGLYDVFNACIEGLGHKHAVTKGSSAFFLYTSGHV